MKDLETIERLLDVAELINSLEKDLTRSKKEREDLEGLDDLFENGTFLDKTIKFTEDRLVLLNYGYEIILNELK